MELSDWNSQTMVLDDVSRLYDSTMGDQVQTPNGMTSFIQAIGTAVPPYAYTQDYAASCMKRWVRDRVLQRMVHHVYRQSGIEQRFSVIPDFQPGAVATTFRELPDGQLVEPTTGERNQLYERTYAPVACAAVNAVFDKAPWLKRTDVTHVITVSCTGFCNPGPDLMVVRACGLPLTTQRYHIGFMGCYAAFPALRMADQFCRANPDAVVLVVCVELCSIHLQIKPTPDALLANALFADGAGAALVSARPAPSTRRSFALEHFATRLIPGTEGDMAWTIGDHGFDMTLSSYVPRILGLHADELIREVVAASPFSYDEIAGWAVHPGGKAILQALETRMGWPADSGPLVYSHRILRDYGNMSSATILFVLMAILEESDLPDHSLLGALAFGPGLTVEFGMLRLVAQPAEHSHA